MSTPTKWKDDIAVHPQAKEIAFALWDPGQNSNAKVKESTCVKHEFPRIVKLAGKIHTNIQRQFHDPEGLTKNVSRGKQPPHREIIPSRKHVDISETNPFFHEFGVDGKVFVLGNKPKNSGLNLAIGHFQDHTDQQMNQKNTARTSNDGLGLACILLDPKFRSSVSGLMTKKREGKRAT